MSWSYAQLEDGTGRVAQEDPSIVHEADFTSTISLESIASIDEAVRLTIAEMPNALRVLENS